MPAEYAPHDVTRVTVEGRHVTPPLVFAFDIHGFDINGLRHNQLVEIAPGLAILATSINYTRERDELYGYVESTAMFERILAWVVSGNNGDVRLVSAPVPSIRAG
jgi:hypothetical protein